VLLALIIGLLLGRNVQPALLVLMALALLPLIIWWLPSWQLRGSLLLCALGACLVPWNKGERTGTPSPWAPREATLELEVTRAFSARKPARISGIARIVSDSVPSADLQGNLTSFYLETPEGSPRHVALGERFLAKAALLHIPGMESKTGFHAYLLRQGVPFTFTQGRVLQTTRAAPLMEQWRLRCLDHFRHALTAGDTNTSTPGFVLAAMLLGDRSLLSDDRLMAFKRSGTLHLFAVSGLHVGSVAATVLILLRILPIARIWRNFTALPLIWSYVFITGYPSSAVRAGIMVSTFLLAPLFSRQPQLFPALILSALLVLLIDPAQLFEAGFRLSYAVVAAIGLIGIPLGRELSARMKLSSSHPIILKIPRQFILRWNRRLIAATCISASAALASMPLIIQYFNLFSPIGLFLGLLLSPLAGILVALGAGIMGLSLLSSTLAALLARAVWPLLSLGEGLIALGLKIPGAYQSRSWSWPETGSIAVATALASAWVIQSRRQGGRCRHLAYEAIPFLIIIAALALSESGT
jgi:competence protein ComEC